MADYIEWQQFEVLDLIIINNDFFSSANIFRDENYNFHFCIKCKQLDSEKPQELGHNKTSSFKHTFISLFLWVRSLTWVLC